MTRKRFSEKSALNLLRQIDLDLASGSAVERAIRTAGISEATYYKWRKMYGGKGKSHLGCVYLLSGSDIAYVGCSFNHLGKHRRYFTLASLVAATACDWQYRWHVPKPRQHQGLNPHGNGRRQSVPKLASRCNSRLAPRLPAPPRN